MWHQRGETKLCILTDSDLIELELCVMKYCKCGIGEVKQSCVFVTDPDLIELELCMNVYSDITVMVDCALSTSYLSCVNVRLGK